MYLKCAVILIAAGFLYSLPALASPFQFCVSTAAHQIEGQNTSSDWWQWEQQPGRIKEGHTSLVATDSWNHVEEDIQALQFLGVDTYRFSIEWAKIEPVRGHFELAQLDRYLELVLKLQKANIKPMITLYHFTLPQWVAEQGGWEWSEIDEAFENYVIKVAEHFRNRAPRSAQWWNTLNEPMTVIAAGYISDVFPPGKKSLKSIAVPMAQMIRAHAKGYHALHRLLDHGSFRVQVGLAHHLRIFEPQGKFNPLDHYFAKKFDEVFNWSIPEALASGNFQFSIPLVVSAREQIPEAKNTQDFFGLNYYSRDLISFHPFAPQKLQRHVAPGAPVQDLGWEIYPEGLGILLKTIHQRYPALSIFVTENGIADRSDQKRGPYLQAHLQQIERARADGVAVEGYCHWTLTDNFEWAEGYTAQFGLYRLTPKTLKREPKPSAFEYKSLIQKLR